MLRRSAGAFSLVLCLSACGAPGGGATALDGADAVSLDGMREAASTRDAGSESAPDDDVDASHDVPNDAANEAAIATPPANAAAFQTVASRALTAALVAWYDRDAVAAQTALRQLAACARDAGWFLAMLDELPIFVGASLVDLAGALDLLAASSVSAAELDAARRDLATAVYGVETWLQAGGQAYMNCHQDNHGMRLGAGVIAAGLVLPPALMSDDLLAWGLAQTAVSMRREAGGSVGWAEGSTYYAYAFEVAAPALTAVDRAWSGAATRCARCPAHAGSLCGSAGSVELVRPSGDPIVRELVL